MAVIPLAVAQRGTMLVLDVLVDQPVDLGGRLITHERRDGGPSALLRGDGAALTGEDGEGAVLGPIHQDGFQDAPLADGGDEIVVHPGVESDGVADQHAARADLASYGAEIRSHHDLCGLVSVFPKIGRRTLDAPSRSYKCGAGYFLQRVPSLAVSPVLTVGRANQRADRTS